MDGSNFIGLHQINWWKCRFDVRLLFCVFFFILSRVLSFVAECCWVLVLICAPVCSQEIDMKQHNKTKNNCLWATQFNGKHLTTGYFCWFFFLVAFLSLSRSFIPFFYFDLQKRKKLGLWEKSEPSNIVCRHFNWWPNVIESSESGECTKRLTEKKFRNDRWNIGKQFGMYAVYAFKYIQLLEVLKIIHRFFFLFENYSQLLFKYITIYLNELWSFSVVWLLFRIFFSSNFPGEIYASLSGNILWSIHIKLIHLNYDFVEPATNGLNRWWPLAWPSLW